MKETTTMMRRVESLPTVNRKLKKLDSEEPRLAMIVQITRKRTAKREPC